MPRFLITIALAWSIAVPVRPQQAAAPGAGVVRVTTRMVEVSVTAVDGQGNPVSNLKADDFELYDQGALQQMLCGIASGAAGTPQLRRTRAALPRGCSQIPLVPRTNRRRR
jgi:hypothetical protein